MLCQIPVTVMAWHEQEMSWDLSADLGTRVSDCGGRLFGGNFLWLSPPSLHLSYRCRCDCDTET
jgi:hypothetical protein